MQTILVTGGAGYIGSHTCKALARAGFLPVSYDNLCGGYEALVKWGPLEIGDILDGTRLDNVIQQYQPAAVIHFAGLLSVGESVEKPDLYHQSIVQGSRSLLAAMQSAKIRTLVFSSTAAVYGDPEFVPMPEQHPLRPENPYGQCKLELEQIITAQEGLEYGILRYFNAAGADEEGETGELHDPETHLIPLALQTAAGTIPTLTVFGDDYPTPDGTCIRDYIHVSDLADAHVATVQHLLAGKGSLIANLGTGKGYSVKQILEQVQQTTGRPVQFQMGGRRAGDPPSLVADATHATQLLNWQPRHSGLDEIISSAWRFMKKTM